MRIVYVHREKFCGKNYFNLDKSLTITDWMQSLLDGPDGSGNFYKILVTVMAILLNIDRITLLVDERMYKIIKHERLDLNR